MNGVTLSGPFSSICFNLLTGLLSCIAACTGHEGAIEITSVFLVGEGWFSMSLVTKSQLSDYVTKALSTHSSFGLNSLSTSFEKLSCLSFAIVVYGLIPKGCLIPLVFVVL
ncbi:hypothetical protein N665_0968s0005 [Sinapis alba]|nr:hypothetical protein N665_0968s0005 [Sinapis alba]